MTRAIVVHGGAWSIPDDLVAAHQQGVLAAAEGGWQVLQQGGTALDAVVRAITIMELDPTFDAGVGAFLNADGDVELDAGLMDGTTLRVGAVGAIQLVKTPIVVARRLLEDSRHSFLVGEGALRYARQAGIEDCRMEELIVDRERRLWESIKARGAEATVPNVFGTVGAVAMDACRNIAAGTSSGGVPFKLPGRIGDTPLVGCGFYADSAHSGASVTGIGEAIMRILMAKRAVDLVAEGYHPQEAAEATVRHLYDRAGGRGGIIVMDKRGEIGYAFNTPRMAYAYKREGMVSSAVGI